MGKRKFRLSVQRKNHERKRWGFYPIRIPIKGGISVYKVSIPLSALSSHQKTALLQSPSASSPTPLLDSLLSPNLAVNQPDYSSHPSSSSSGLVDASTSLSLNDLRRQLQCAQLPPGWFLAPGRTESEDVTICCFDEASDSLLYSLRIANCFSWTLSLRGVALNRSVCPLLTAYPELMASPLDVLHLLKALSSFLVCEGNSDQKFLKLSHSRKGCFVDVSGTKKIANQEEALLRRATIRHTDCAVLLPPASKTTRCSHCESHRHTLRSLVYQTGRQAADKTAPDSHVNYRFLSTPEKTDRLQRMHSELRANHLKKERLKAKLERVVEEEGITVDSETHTDICAIMTSAESQVMDKYPEDSFQYLFWKQQQEAARLKNSCSMRWHPLFIKWCLYLRHVSGRAYETLRKCIRLPSQRTLRDYTHYIKASTGFSDDVDLQLAQAANTEHCAEHEKYVAIIFDEMYIKEDLVYNKHTNALVGFANLGDINTHLLAFEESLCTSPSNEVVPLAKTMMVLMVRGLCSGLEFPYAQFACSSVTGDLLFQPFWEAVRRLEFLGLKVVAATADGASTNRRFFRLHALSSSTMPHCVKNPYTSEDRQIYFFSDAPHLLKTARNALASTKRNLMCEGKELRWQHILDLYSRNTGAIRSAPGLSLVPKLTYEHVKLTSFSKMRVDLAAEVLSESVHKALVATGGEAAQGTALFVQMFDRFFDCLNVNSFTAGKQKRKPFQSPYRSANDFRLKWLENDFIGYLNKWEESVQARDGLTKTERNNMLLSPETRLGLRTTVKSFVALVRFLFTVPGVTCFLSEKLCQDPLEKFFGCQRQRGGVNENPTVQEFCSNTQALRVVNSVCQNVSRGNCRGRKSQPIDWEKENMPLPKRRRRHK